MHAYAPETSEAGVAVAMKLLGVGEGALDGFLAAAINGLAPGGLAVGVGALARLGPDMARDQAGGIGANSEGCRPPIPK